MGSRDDNFVDDERFDAAFRRLLARSGQPADLSPPPDLVTRSLRRLPDLTPALAEQQARRSSAGRWALRVFVLGFVALVALLALLNVLVDAQMPLLFGDGASGLSRLLLMLRLMAKPLLGALGALGAPLLLSGALGGMAAAGLWWWLLRRTPAYAYAEQL